MSSSSASSLHYQFRPKLKTVGVEAGQLFLDKATE